MEVDEEDINPSVYLRLQPDNQEPDSSFREEDVTATSSSIRSSVFLRNVLRTQSMDESRNYDRVNTRMTRARSIPMVTGDETVATSTAAVNASFDMSMLHHHQLPHASHWHNYQHSSEQSPTTSSAQDLRTLRATASWDEHDSSTTKKRSTKHRAHFAVDMPELPLHSVTKKKRESPVRLRFRPGTTTTSTIKTKGKLTPASGKRHRLRTRSSPLHRLPTTPRAESAALRLLALPAEQHSYYEPATVTKRKPKRSLGTCTTAASSTQLEEETTMDNSTDNSVDTQDTVTNFRFTSFPASLPRIHNNKSNGTIMTTSAGCPNTVRKRMSFGSVTTAALHNNTNNDSHNTSVSSLQHDYFGYSDGDNDDDGDAAIDVGNDEDDPEESAAQSSLQGTPVTRTRLNFNALASSPLAMESKLLDDAEDQGTCVVHSCLFGVFD